MPPEIKPEIKPDIPGFENEQHLTPQESGDLQVEHGQSKEGDVRPAHDETQALDLHSDLNIEEPVKTEENSEILSVEDTAPNEHQENDKGKAALEFILNGGDPAAMEKASQEIQ